MKVRHRCYSTQWLGGSASGPKRNGSPPLRPTPSGRRSPGAGWRPGRRSYLPGRDERSEERSGRSRSRGGGRCRFVEAEGRSDATPDRSRSRPEVRGGIVFHTSCAREPPTMDPPGRSILSPAASGLRIRLDQSGSPSPGFEVCGPDCQEVPAELVAQHAGDSVGVKLLVDRRGATVRQPLQANPPAVRRSTCGGPLR